MILYLAKHLTKVENRISELLRKVAKEAANQDILAKLRKMEYVSLIIRGPPHTLPRLCSSGIIQRTMTNEDKQ